MKKSMYQRGYDDGCRLNPIRYPLSLEYNKGYEKGKSDKELSDTYSDEALGIFEDD